MRAFFLFLLVPIILQAKTVEITQAINYLEVIEFQGVGKMILQQGKRPGLKIIGDENSAYDTRVRASHGRLTISRHGSRFKPPSELTCIVTVDNDLNEVVLRDEVHLESGPLTLVDMQFDVHDKATCTVQLSADDFLGRVYDSGKLTVSGNVKRAVVQVEDLGEYDASALVSRNCSVKLIGSGLAKVQADESLSAFVVGAGKIIYVKEPQKITKRVSGTGAITPP